MRLYSGKIPAVASEIIRSLSDAGDIEVGDVGEAQLDVEAVLKEFLRMEREITDRTKDLLESRSLPYDQFGKIKRAVAEERGFGLGEESLNWICNQILETFMQSAHVDEIYADDATMRRKMRDILKKHMQVDEALDEEVRRRIKNLQEGTATWEIEYQKVLEQIKRNRGIE
ncbi:MAG TPA: DUF507 family protein [Polyangia bacterium]|nr:DUF507 family protein [Polyangia bacterium]